MTFHGVTGDWLGLIPADQAGRIQLKLQENEKAFKQSLREGTLEPRNYLKEEHRRLTDLLTVLPGIYVGQTFGWQNQRGAADRSALPRGYRYT